ncbi:MAG: PA0069 family radical SAM protein [Planctomycetes bacterium]|nr:PA0069 family radical SAM protein [Planctomycetota bacterium]
MRRVENPPNPWQAARVELLGPAPEADLEVFEEEAKTIVSENDSPDIPFRWSLNPYRGCFHGCAYCYARPTHQYLGFGAGTDFERRIVVKQNAPELLRRRLQRSSWRGETIVFSGVTDCYQPLEASYRLTRRCLEVCAEYRQPVGIITKGALIERDVDVLADLARHGAASVFVSVPFADEADARRIEPYAGSPARRLAAVRLLSDAGVPTGVSVSPLIPGLNDHQVPEILRRARDAGARHAFHVLLRVPAEVEEVFTQRLRQAFPLRAAKVMSLLAAMRGGRAKDARFHARMAGQGPRYQVIVDLFERTARALGLSPPAADGRSPFRRPGAQQLLFGGDEAR